VFTKASPKLQQLLEEVLQSTVKSVRYYPPKGLSNPITGAGFANQLKEIQVHPTSVLWWFLPSEVELVFEEEIYLDCTKLLLGAPVFIEEELHSL